jgi:hypothetical protein
LEHAVAFDQITLDYVWMPNGYFETRIATFIVSNLEAFALKLLKPLGSVYLPFHILTALVSCSSMWEPYYVFVLVSLGDIKAMSENLLWAATESICSNTMNFVFKKEPRQENKYCKVSKMALNCLPKTSLVSSALLGIVDEVETYRFIRLC